MEPSTNVGTEMLFENDLVRGWSMELAPGQASPFHIHIHTLDYVYVYVTPSRLTFIAEPGDVENVRNDRDGYARYTAVGDRHQISNVSEGVHRQVLAELKARHASLLRATTAVAATSRLRRGRTLINPGSTIPRFEKETSIGRCTARNQH